jgi:outer membrane protein assembly factor BamA
MPRPATARQVAQPGDTLAEVRIHGNHTTPDSEVMRLAGLVIGQTVDAEMVQQVEVRLRKSGRFEDVEIRKRYRSLAGTGDVALIIIVREHPVPADRPPSPLGPFRKVFDSGLFLPVLSYTDGYGLTYGARFTFVDTLGRGGRISVPLTWGGSKRAAVELEKPIAHGVVDSVQGGAAISRRENPFYRLDDDRRQVWAGARREIVKGLRIGVHGGFADVSFAGLHDHLATYGADVALDTRLDPVFPRNAVFARLGWDGLDPRSGPRVNTLHADVVGYVGLVGLSVVSVRWQYARADGPLPIYERFLLGGADSLRGYRAGSFSGDNLAAGSIELSIPLSSPLRISRLGIDLFADTGTAYDRGTRLADARFRSGVGGGVFLASSLFRFNADLAYRTAGGGVRLHIMAGIVL